MSTPWKTRLQILDLAADARIEVECKTCEFFRYEEAKYWQQDSQSRQLFLDEFEASLSCHKWGCGNAVRISLPSNHETEGFQGGLA